MIERRIKELTIALEALSRIQAGYDTYTRVNDLLDNVIKQAQEQYKIEQTQILKFNPNDDIPF